MTRRPLPLLALAAVLVGLLGLSGCLSVPRSGPVVSTQVGPAPGQDSIFSIVPAGPAKGATPAQIVEGFLDAMQATPISTTVAREFLGGDLASSWDPSRRTITYTDKSSPSGPTPGQGDQGDLSVQLFGADWLDGGGTWRGTLPGSPQLRFRLRRVQGEWRIVSAPNALVVPESWFDDRFTQVSLYFFDPTARILVPEPIFVPRGSQLATSLVSDLLHGPSGPAGRALRTFLPSGGTEGLSVPVTGGVAQVEIASPARADDRTLALMRAQLAWTLRQDPTVRSVQLSFGDARGGAPEGAGVAGGSAFKVSTGEAYDPDGPKTSQTLYGLRGGVLGAVGEPAAGDFTPVDGPWAQAHAVRSARVSLGNDLAAGVSSNGRQLLTGPVGLGRTGGLRSALTGTDLLPPVWDFADRVWSIDRSPHGAVVRYAPVDARGVPGRARVVRVPGISGGDVRAFTVSRDGTRLVAVLGGAAGDNVVLSRLVAGYGGEVTAGTRAVQISDPIDTGADFLDLAWASPTSLYALQQLPDFAEVRTLSVDGSGYDASTLTVGDRIDGLISSPIVGQGIYAVSNHGLLDLSGQGRDLTLATGVSSVAYAG